MRKNAKKSEPKASWLGGVKSAAIVLLIMLLSTTTAWAAKGDVVATGTCGDNLTWTLTENGEDDFTYKSKTYTPLTLTITGTGEMKGHAIEMSPWQNYEYAITQLELPEGMTHVGSYAFYNTCFVKKFTLPASVTSIDYGAFEKAGSQVSKGCTFTAATGSKLKELDPSVFLDFGGNVDLRNCTSLTTIKEKAFVGYMKKTLYLPISIKTIKANAFGYRKGTKPKVLVSCKNSVLYVNGTYKAFDTEAKNIDITSDLNIRSNKSDALSIYRVSLDEIKLTFDENDHSFVIANEQDLLSLSDYVRSSSFRNFYFFDVSFKLTNDLDFTNMPDFTNSYGGKFTRGNFVPIGANYMFFGHFDGGGHTISGLRCSYVEDKTSVSIGLFSTVDYSNTIIENLTLVNPNFIGYKKCVGGIVAGINAGTVRNCTVVGGTLNSNGNDKYINCVGGIVGYVELTDEKSVNIDNCTVVGTNICDGIGGGCIVGTHENIKHGTLNLKNNFYDANIGLPIIVDDSYANFRRNKPLYRLNLGYGVKSDAPTYGDYVVATKGTTVNLDATASREWYDFAGFKSDDVTINNGQFTMPAESVNVEINWEAQENISVKASQVNGLYWTTFYCGDAGYYILEDEEAFAYTATVHDDEIILHSLGKYIPMGSAVIIAGEDNSISMKRDDYGYPDFSVDNDLKGVDWPTARTSLTSNDANTLYMLSNKNNHFGFHSFAGANVPARKAFFTVPSSANARPFSMVFENETTSARQLLITNHESSVSNSRIYDLNGRVVNGNNLKPGIYVKNGKKIVVK